LSCSTCASPMARPDSTVSYLLTGESSFGCRATDSVLVTVKQPFKINTSRGDTLCKGESYQLDVSGADRYAWSPAAGLDDAASSHPKVRPDSTTTYRVIGRDNEGCFTDTSFVPMVVYPYPLVNAGADKTIMGGNSVTLSPVISADVMAIRWTPEKGLSCYDCSSPLATPKQTTKYSIKVSNEGGCVATSELNIFVLCEEGNLFLPNTFSPNGDGVNDVFYPRGKGIYSIRNLRVFNRWGEVVFGQSNFQANDISKGWNGTINGKLASQDVYVYTIDVICENNVVFSFKGNVALIR
jgi:gliding motility-associated-like protein